MSFEKSPSLAGREPERSPVLGAPEPACVICGGPRNPRKWQTCSDACRTALNRQRKAEARRERDAEIRALLEAALEKLREEP